MRLKWTIILVLMCGGCVTGKMIRHEVEREAEDVAKIVFAERQSDRAEETRAICKSMIADLIAQIQKIMMIGAGGAGVLGLGYGATTKKKIMKLKGVLENGNESTDG